MGSRVLGSGILPWNESIGGRIRLLDPVGYRMKTVEGEDMAVRLDKAGGPIGGGFLPTLTLIRGNIFVACRKV